MILLSIYRRCYIMPSIRASADLRNKYNEVSEFCHKYGEIKINFAVINDMENRIIYNGVK